MIEWFTWYCHCNYAALIYLLYSVSTTNLLWWELAGRTVSISLLCGTSYRCWSSATLTHLLSNPNMPLPVLPPAEKQVPLEK